MYILAIDPGQDKCGIAVVSSNCVFYQAVVKRNAYLEVVKSLIKRYNIKQLVLGDGTGSREFFQELSDLASEISISVVDERFSTEEARKLYWEKESRKGWRRFFPTSLQVPPKPYDDYVAIILAKRFLKKGRR